jgi:ribosomal protein S12 methylthiotransferase accessory factor
MNYQLKRTKAYKAIPPLETVKHIKTILEEIGLHLKEIQTDNQSFFHPTMLNIINPENDQIIFTTYGKGLSQAWASASVWGEMIERIQNLAFYMIFIYPSEPEPVNPGTDSFKYFPDEKLFEAKGDAECKFEEKYRELTGLDHLEPYKRIIGIPFFSVFDKTLEFLPFRPIQIIAGSNGMCSGNTRDEALIQGISEIFERFVLKSIYLNPFCPPDIPLSCFSETETSSIITHLTKNHRFSIRIKDCSMDMNYPVIGVLIRNDKQEYSFHLGSDPNPITALERCFTEMHQGGRICFKSLRELYGAREYNLDNPFWRKNLSDTIRSYSGHWPPRILEETASYPFTGFKKYDSVSDNKDLEYLMSILKKENRKLLIRDNSFLGQPAFHVYIPGMSNVTDFPDNEFSNSFMNFDACLNILTCLKRSTVKTREKMSSSLKSCLKSTVNSEFLINDCFRFFPMHPLSRLTIEQFSNLTELSLLKGSTTDYFDESQIKSIPVNVFETVVKKLRKPSDLFQNIGIPECFDCHECNWKGKCNYPYIRLVGGKIKERILQCPIDQQESLYFETV